MNQNLRSAPLYLFEWVLATLFVNFIFELSVSEDNEETYSVRNASPIISKKRTICRKKLFSLH